MDFFSPFDTKPFGGFSTGMGGMGSHLASPMSSYYGAGMSGMTGLSSQFAMPGVNYNSVQSAMTMSSMAGTMAGMSSLGGAGQAGTASLPAASSYPGTSSPYPGSTSPLSSAMQHSVIGAMT